MKATFLASISLIILSIFSCGSDNNSDETTGGTPNPESGITTTNVKSYMVDKSATTETSALFYNLKKNASTDILLGHQDAFIQFYQNTGGSSDVKKTTGADPALIGLDFMFITDKANDGSSGNWFYQQEQKIVDAAKEAYNKGMAVTFAWHLREPYQEDYFYTSQMTTEQKSKAFKSILVGGENHLWYQKKLDKVASVLNGMVGADGKKIPVIFRPFHEFDGDWFWWGAQYSTAEEYKQLFQFTVKYLRDIKQVHNVLYAFSPDASFTTSTKYLERYPGDEYVDVLGMDNYQDFTNQSNSGMIAANNKLKIISDFAKSKNKIAALTETGYSSKNTISRTNNHFTALVYPAITNNKIEISYICFWTNSDSEYYVPTPNSVNAEDFRNFSKMSKIKLQNTISKPLYKFP